MSHFHAYVNDLLLDIAEKSKSVLKYWHSQLLEWLDFWTARDQHNYMPRTLWYIHLAHAFSNKTTDCIWIHVYLPEARPTAWWFIICVRISHTHLIEMDVLHADVLHHRCFFVNVWSHDAERRAALLDHACTRHKHETIFLSSDH